MRDLGVAIALALAWAGPAFAQPATRPPIVVELFTSQGCSSCPPADAFLTDLARTDRRVLPLAFHVTYWDRLGWRDPFSLPAATERQRDYARTLGENGGDGGVYTPEMVVAGAAGFVGSERAQGLAAIERAASSDPSVPLQLRREGRVVTIVIGAGRNPAEIILVGYDPEHRTPIGRGENSGRTLLESNIVRSLTPLGPWTGQPLRLTAPIADGERFAVLLQAANGHILAAAAEGRD